jgi:AcrR family transcriptional regulator
VSKPTQVGEQRRRLSLDARREELLRVGMELFSTRSYEDICVEEIAARAGVSRGLLYHYFPTKRDFYLAVTRAAAAEVGELTAADGALPLLERLRGGIDAFLGYAAAHQHGFLTAYRGSLAADPEVRATVEEGRLRQTARILDGLERERKSSAPLRLAVYGWTAMAQAVTAEWLRRREPPREVVRELLADVLMGAIEAAHRAGGAAEPALGSQVSSRTGRRRPSRTSR